MIVKDGAYLRENHGGGGGVVAKTQFCTIGPLNCNTLDTDTVFFS